MKKNEKKEPGIYSVKEVLARMEAKLDVADSRLDSIDKTLIRQEASLDKHILRTNQNEEMLQIVRGEVHGVRTELRPIKRHVQMIEGVAKLIGFIAVIVGIVATSLRIVGVL